MRKVTSVVLLGLMCLFSYPVWGQDVGSVKVKDQTDSVEISYVLSDSLEGRSYQVKIFALTPTDTVELTKLKGGVGDQVAAGAYKVTWYARQEWERYRGPLKIEVRALPNFSFIEPRAVQEIRRGQGVAFRWYGENSTLDTLRIDLFHYNNHIDTLDYLNEASEFSWQVPNDLALGEGYRIRIVGLEKSNIEEFSKTFTVTRRIPLTAQITAGGVLVAGAIVAYILRWLPKPILADDRR